MCIYVPHNTITSPHFMSTVCSNTNDLCHCQLSTFHECCVHVNTTSRLSTTLPYLTCAHPATLTIHLSNIMLSVTLNDNKANSVVTVPTLHRVLTWQEWLRVLCTAFEPKLIHISLCSLYVFSCAIQKPYHV